MAEAIGLASGCVALATFAIQSSITLFEAIRSFQSHSQRVRDLSGELHALCGVLRALNTTIQALPDFDFSALNFPLLRCGNACEDFRKELEKCSSRSKNDRTSFRDWAKLRYMGEDIDGFRRLLSSYKMTISIALTDANLRKSAITAENIQAYNDLLISTQTDLEDQLDRINTKLELIGDTLVVSKADAEEVKLIKDERTSTEKCLQICAQLSDHISQIQLTTTHRTSSASSDKKPSPEQITEVGLQECKINLAGVVEKLKNYDKELFNRLVDRTKVAATSEEERSDLARLHDQWETNRQGLDICSKAYDNLRENVSNIDNYATGDAVQFLVSTSEKVIHGKNRGLGWRTRQVGGDIDPESFRQMMRSLEVMDLPSHLSQVQSSDHNISADSSSLDESQGASRFHSQYGKGFQLAPGPPNVASERST